MEYNLGLEMLSKDHFVWKLLRNGAPVRQWLHNRFPNIEDRCPRCGEEGESIIHCLVYCIQAKQTWQISPLAGLDTVSDELEPW
ncbi:hypothetical protein AHAS_Ahas11G0021700 [Arachis hypogaea]